MIPTTLHRIWVGAPPPQDYLDNADTWRDANPGIEVVEWDEEAIAAFGLQNQDLWDMAPDIQPSRLVPRLRSDIARYEILHRLGGVYADHDYRCLQPFWPHIAGMACFAVAEKPGLIANGLMGCTPGHPYMRALIDELGPSVRKQPNQQTWRMAGPGFVTRIAKGRGDLQVLPQDRFLPYHHTQLGSEVLPDDAVLEHTWGSARGQVSVIIPWREDSAERRAGLDKVLERYRVHRDWQIIVAPAPQHGEFNKAAAVNAAVKRSFGETIVVADADLLCDGVEDAVDQVRAGAKWVMPYDTLYRLNRAATKRVLAGAAPQTVKSMVDGVEPYGGVIGGGIVVVSRAAMESVPMDERFVGWGGEDISWGLALKTLAGRPRRVRSDLYHLWHPPTTEHHPDHGSDANTELYRRYQKATGHRTRMRSLLAAAR